MLGGHVTAVTDEEEPTYYWPAALQRYTGADSGIAGGVTIRICALTYEDIVPPRRVGSPAFRVGYCIGAGAELPVYPGAVIINVQCRDGQWAARLAEAT
jgi:hypothetical protein